MKIFSKSNEIKELQPEKAKPKDDKRFAPPSRLPEIKKPLPPPPSPPRSVRPPMPPRPSMPSQSPPLFIKVDKYRQIIKNIRDLKSHILNLRDALDVLEDMQREVANGVQIAHKTLDELNVILSNLDSVFLRPQGIDHHMEEEDLPEPGRPPAQVDNYMSNVQTQLEKLRAQLKAIE